MPETLERYRKKRDFKATPEPTGGRRHAANALQFVIQKHAASHLHYDFRLELDGVLKSWAVPKGPSLDPSVKRMAVQVEDHPIDYAGFEGEIPAGQYGAGSVLVWDTGTWEPIGNAQEGYASGKLKFALHGKKLRGYWMLVRMHSRESERQIPWLLIKERDDEARPADEYDVLLAEPDSALAATSKKPRAAGSAATIEPLVTKAIAATKATTSAAASPASTLRKTPSSIAKKSPAGKLPRAAKKSPQLLIGGVAVSHPDRVIDASTGITKAELVEYYQAVSKRLMPHLLGRPLSLLRAPEGLAGPMVFQRHGERLSIPGLIQLDANLWPDHPALIAIAQQAGIIGAAQMNAIELHTWNACADRIDRPDRLVFDLDPGEKLAFDQVLESTRLTVGLLKELGLAAFIKTSGGKGMHVVVPIARRYGWDSAKDFSEAVVQKLATTMPERFVAKSGPKNRIGRVFVDFLRNGKGATTATAFSVRARPGLGVSMPIAAAELADLDSASQWTAVNAVAMLKKRRSDPWKNYQGAQQQRLEAAARRLGHNLKGSS